MVVSPYPDIVILPYGAGRGHREINVLVSQSVSELVGRGKIYLALCRSDITVAIFVGISLFFGSGNLTPTI